MSNEVEVMDAVAVQNYQAAHSVMVMEQWGKANTKKLTEEDLNSITFPGIYGQILNIYATPERNYPTAKAGSLLSMPSAYNSDADLASPPPKTARAISHCWPASKSRGAIWINQQAV